MQSSSEERANEISKTVERAAQEIINQWDNLKRTEELTLHQFLIQKADKQEAIVPRDVLFTEELEILTMKYMGDYYYQFGWCVASAVYNVAAGFPMKGKND